MTWQTAWKVQKKSSLKAIWVFIIATEVVKWKSVTQIAMADSLILMDVHEIFIKMFFYNNTQSETHPDSGHRIFQK